MEAVSLFLKSQLPPRASFALRYAKSRIVDAEMAELGRFAKFLGGPDTCALDVGANAGLYSTVLAKHMSQVLSFEPHPDCAAYMRRVLPSNCTVIEAAASDGSGNSTLRVPIANGASQTTRSTISPSNSFDGLAVSGTNEIEVRSEPLDAIVTAGLLAGCSVTLMKVDVEGHELPVLTGALGLIERFRPGLHLELETRHGADTATVFRLLRRLDYRAVRHQAGRHIAVPMPDDRSEATGSVNVMALPRERIPAI